MCQVDKITGRDPLWTVITTGHSLGGALAITAAEDFATRRYAPSDTRACFTDPCW